MRRVGDQPATPQAGGARLAVAEGPRPISFAKEAIQRLLVAALFLGVGYGLWNMGRHIIRTGEYDYTLETSDGERGAKRRATREVVHATGAWAQEQAVGFMAAGVTLAYWGALVLLGPIGPFTSPLVWSPLRSAMMAVSLGGCLVSVIAFLPPWRIGRSMSCNAFYIVLAACIYLATIRDRARLKERSLKVFPALIGTAVLVGSFSSGYVVGIISGIFICLLLAFHILMLIPRARVELMKADD